MSTYYYSLARNSSTNGCIIRHSKTWMGLKMEKRPLSVPVFQILVSLSDRRLHGYAILRDIKHRTNGQVSLTASTLYSAVNRLLESGWIQESDDRPAPELDDERRRYFAITEAGLDALRQELARMEWMIGTVRDKSIRSLSPGDA